MLSFFLGVLAGVAAGLGLGGASLLVPSLMFVSGVSQLQAQSAGLFGFIPAAIISTVVNIREKRIDMHTFSLIAIPGLITAWFGSKLAFILEGMALRSIFAGFIIIIGLSLLYNSIFRNQSNNIQ